MGVSVTCEHVQSYVSPLLQRYPVEKRGMAVDHSKNKKQVVFSDVSLAFSQEEWECLGPAQRLVQRRDAGELQPPALSG